MLMQYCLFLLLPLHSPYRTESGLETFQIPHQKLAEDLQLKCASSATFGEVNGSSPKKPVYEVVVQGSQTAVVVKELADTWGVPKNWISIAK